MTNFKDATDKLKQMTMDMDILRYLITNSTHVHSTATKDPMGCHYIYVKPGMANEVMEVSNIDFVQQIYALNGINLKKHVSHLDGQTVEVLYISNSEEAELTDQQRKFLNETAPLDYSQYNKAANNRASEIVNMVFHKQNSKNQVTR